MHGYASATRFAMVEVILAALATHTAFRTMELLLGDVIVEVGTFQTGIDTEKETAFLTG